jgi:hypothetical protein
MKPLNLADVTEYVEQNIGTFHSKRLEKLEALQLNEVMARKNPYLFKAKGIGTAQDLVKVILDAHLSSQEETIFGDFLEGLAIFVCERVYRGRKSLVEGIDLEFERDGVLYVVAIKSGPNWGNSSQIARMRDNFRKAQRVYRTNNNRRQQVMMVNGCCYGRTSRADQGDYLKLSGQSFWELISGDNDLYIKIIEPLGHRAKERNETFLLLYDQVVNRFVGQFMREFFDGDLINWEKLVRFNSAAIKETQSRRRRV